MKLIPEFILNWWRILKCKHEWKLIKYESFQVGSRVGASGCTMWDRIYYCQCKLCETKRSMSSYEFEELNINSNT